MDILLDNSAISLLYCKRRFQLTVLEGLVSPPNQFSSFGDAFHKALEVLDLNGSADDAYAQAVARNPTVEKLLLLQTITLFKAVHKMPTPINMPDGKPAIEVKFKYLYGSFITEQGKHVNIYLSGTIDRISDDKGVLEIMDYKTACDFSDAKQKEKMEDYELALQLPFYTFALHKAGILPAHYQQLIEQGRYRTSILFAFYASRPPLFRKQSHPNYNAQFLFTELPRIINDKVSDAIKITQLGNAPAPYTGMSVYKGCVYCPFRTACLHAGTDKEVELLSRFERREYNPLTFR